jgi:predicted nuclease with TOPRIM domain
MLFQVKHDELSKVSQDKDELEDKYKGLSEQFEALQSRESSIKHEVELLNQVV